MLAATPVRSRSSAVLEQRVHLHAETDVDGLPWYLPVGWWDWEQIGHPDPNGQPLSGCARVSYELVGD